MNPNKSLFRRWAENAEKFPEKEAIVHWHSDAEPIRWSFSSLLAYSRIFTEYLIKKGIVKGDVCAIIIRHKPYFYPLYMGIVGLGALPAVLAYPNTRLHPDKFRQGLEGISQRSGLDWILTESDLLETINPFLAKSESINNAFTPLEDLNLTNKIPENVKFDINSIKNGAKNTDPFLLQHSSGTTGVQKPVLLSNEAVFNHIENYSLAIGLKPDDKVASWLPLYHDMGLIAAFHLPLAYGITSIQIDPFEWTLCPELLIEAITQEKATLSWLPNFAYNMMADKIRLEDMENPDMSSIRLLINCSEPVRQDSHDKFYEKFKSLGLTRNVLSACYAMAETTYAVTQTGVGEEAIHKKFNRERLSAGVVELETDPIKARFCVSSGKLIDGCEMKIVDENRELGLENKVGEIAIKSVSMFDGYRNYPEKTAAVLSEGWYYSGDYGFIWDDELYVIGRKKDIIIVAGKNIYPEDVENIVSYVVGIIPGRVTAFGEFDEELGTEQISVVAETKLEDEKSKWDLELRIRQTGIQSDININKVYLVPPKWLIKSSAGKPSRSANKERILNEQF